MVTDAAAADDDDDDVNDADNAGRLSTTTRTTYRQLIILLGSCVNNFSESLPSCAATGSQTRDRNMRALNIHLLHDVECSKGRVWLRTISEILPRSLIRFLVASVP